MGRTYFRTTRYACAVLLIISSIALAFYQVADIRDVASGVLMYIAQAFLLDGVAVGGCLPPSALPPGVFHGFMRSAQMCV